MICTRITTVALLGILSASLLTMEKANAAASFTLTQANSVVSYDDTSPPAGPNGVISWTVDSGTGPVNQLYQQYFFYRIGSTAETPISALGLSSVVSNGVDQATVTYSNGLISISVKYSLTAQPVGTTDSDLAELITVHNNTLAPIADFHFFQYSDFDLNGTPGDDSLYFTAGNTVKQYDSAAEFQETVVTGGPEHYQGDITGAIIASLTDLFPTTLSDTPSPFNSVVGPGDAEWAFQWDTTLAAGHFVRTTFVPGVFTISKDKTLRVAESGEKIVPEASSLAIWGLLGLSVSVGTCFRRKRSA